MRKVSPLFLMWLFPCAALAANIGSVPTCYNESIPPHNKIVTNAEIFVLIDQTTIFDKSLKQSIADNVRRFLRPGNAFSVTQFSAFTQGHYTDVLASGKLDPVLAKALRDDVSKPALNKFDQCMAVQPVLAGQLVGKAMKAAFANSSSDISKSDVVAALKQISGRVRQSTASHKVVLIASDMLENSSVSSFYQKRAVRQINPEQEIKLVANNQLFGDFGGARVYVIGGGLLEEDSYAKGVYRSPQTIQALSTFWAEYFQRSNAKLIEFGQPALLNPVQ